MQGIFAEKTCSATLGQTVNPGDTLTYTFTLFNTNSYAASIRVADKIPENTRLLVNGQLSDQTELSWTVDLSAREKKSFSYQVMVSVAAEEGSAILCTDESTVCGVITKATPVFVGRTLTAEEQARIVQATKSMIGTSMDAIELLNKIYKDALGIESVIDVALSELPDAVFPVSGDLRALAQSGYYSEIIAPSLYGGRTVVNCERYLGERTRLLRERNLVVGDVLYIKATSTYGLYIYLGNGELLDLSGSLRTMDIEERLEVTLGWPMFAILRPSLAFQN